jgi:spermidine/putrescine transport system substrate-binding protein
MSIAKRKFVRFLEGLFLFSMVLFLMGCFESKKTASEAQEVSLAIWGNYLTDDLIKKFTQQTGIKVNVSNYTSNEELLAKVQAGSSGIDIAVPSDYMVSIMVKLGLLHELDSQQIPNRELVSPEVLGQKFDPQNKYSMPFAWTTAGIAVNRELFKGKIKSWRDVLANPALKGKISLLDDVREVTAAALKMHGYSVNTVNPLELKKAEATLISAKPLVKMFRSDTIEALIKKEVAVAHSYSADALQAANQTKGKIEYILPEEGGTKAIDTLVILKGAKNIAAVHKLINFLLSSEVNVSFVTNQMGGPVLKATRALLPADLQKNASLFPSAAQLSKFEGIEDVGDSTKMYDDLWTRVKTE